MLPQALAGKFRQAAEITPPPNGKSPPAFQDKERRAEDSAPPTSGREPVNSERGVGLLLLLLWRFLNRPVRRISPSRFEHSLHFRNNVLMVFSHIGLFGAVVLQIVKLERLIRLRADSFPFAHANGLLKATLMEFPVKPGMQIRLRLAKEGRCE